MQFPFKNKLMRTKHNDGSYLAHSVHDFDFPLTN